jgi:hypothetical protein
MPILNTARMVAMLVVATSAAACDQAQSPARPSEAAVPAPSRVAESGAAAVTAAATGHPSPTDLASRGWTCFTPPVPNRVVCSRPNQGVPTVGNPPPQDRPATFTFWLFDGSGAFTGTELLIRTDLYQGQLCESTGALYDFRPAIGYYECVHTPGPS